MRRIATGRIGATVTVAAVVFLAHVRVVADDFTRLFCIERSQNANVVCYDARLRRDRTLDRDDPIDAYWIMRAENGRREKLSWLERKLAYGFTILGRPSDSGFRFRLDALPQRLIEVRRADRGFLAVTPIGGRPARLGRVYVQLEPGGGKPKVRYVEVYGDDLETGSRRVERVTP